jgi:bifunctional non-homologous end joining protein LigD
VRRPQPGIVLNEHYDGNGEIVFKHACKLGYEGIVSKRLGALYRSGRSPSKSRGRLGTLNWKAI